MNTPYLMVAEEKKVKLCGNGVCSDVMAAIFTWISHRQARL